MKYLRWQGAASFFVIVGLIALFFYLFAELIIQKSIEKGVSWYTRAEVNVARVELEYSPLTIEILDFQATDAENPTTNLIAFKQAKADIHLWQYLLGKVEVDELVIDGLSFSSPRKSAGDIYFDKVSEDELDDSGNSTSNLADIKQNLPDPKKVLDDSDLLTVKASKALSESYVTESKKLKSLKEGLPSKETLANYEEKVKALSKMEVKSLDDLQLVKAKYDELKKQFKADKTIVNKAKDQLAASKDIIAKNLADLKEAPAKDWQAVEEKYQLDNIDGADFAHLLFGEQAREYYDTAMMVYQKLSPLLASGETVKEEEKASAKGRFVFFNDENPLPALLIHKSRLLITMPQGDFSIDIEELNYQHWLRKKPTTYSLTSKNVNQKGNAELTGKFDLTQAGLFNTDGHWLLADMPITDANLRESDGLSLTLKQGNLFAKGQYIASNDSVDSKNTFTLKNGVYDGSADNQMGKLVLDTVSSLEELALSVNADGALASPSWHISSPIDNALKDAVGKKVDEKLASFKADMQAGLNEKVATSLNMPNDGKAQLLDLESLLNDSDNSLDNLMDSDVIKQQEDKLKGKLKDKAKDKLKDKLGGLFK